MSAPFRLDGWTFSSSAFDVLGEIAGYNAHEARGRWARAGSEATERQSTTFSAAAIRGLFGARGVEALVAAELAEMAEDGVHLLRMDGKIEWYGDNTSNAQRAGRARAAGAKRDARGRLLPSTNTSDSSAPPASAGVAGPAQTSAAPAESSLPDLVLDQDQKERDTRVRARHPEAGRVGRRVWDYALAKSLDLRERNVALPAAWPVHHGSSHPGWIALLDRVCELLVDRDAEHAEHVGRNRVDVAFAVALKGDAQFFTPLGMFTRNSFAHWSTLDPAQVGAKPARSSNGSRGGFAAAVMRIAQEEP